VPVGPGPMVISSLYIRVDSGGIPGARRVEWETLPPSGELPGYHR
jgi:hypothetical protein